MSLEALQNLGRNIDDYNKSPQTPVSRVLEAFTLLSISRMKTGLRDAGKESASNLAQSIAPQPIAIDGGSMSIIIDAEHYWDYVNSGVNGTERRWGAPYSFRKYAARSSTGISFKQSMKAWIVKRSIKQIVWTNKEGENVVQYIQSEKDLDAAAYVFMQGVKRKGIEPTHFVDDALTDKDIEALQESLLDAVAGKLFKDL